MRFWARVFWMVRQYLAWVELGYRHDHDSVQFASDTPSFSFEIRERFRWILRD